ncbi:hypothetical protein Y1Q_0013684 [Alligator mississippiensis]|uniref:Uncharacterized protein n=1 Tax=Alligator mississippiensis TaxID=8496 RepID=A0A151P4K9_ALLMI|nr:hypothetical protein Y1Q_0013684 [Alligator mississippiensis]
MMKIHGFHIFTECCLPSTEKAYPCKRILQLSFGFGRSRNTLYTIRMTISQRRKRKSHLNIILIFYL